MLDLWLIRHGESVGNVDGSGSDTGLTDRGREQAQGLRAQLESVELDQVMVSPLLRARNTAALALPHAHAVVEERIRELVVPGESFLDVSQLDPAELERLLSQRQAPTGVESGPAFMARVESWLASLPREGCVAAFSHFAVLRECLRQTGARELPQRIGFCEVVQVQLE